MLAIHIIISVYKVAGSVRLGFVALPNLYSAENTVNIKDVGSYPLQ